MRIIGGVFMNVFLLGAYIIYFAFIGGVALVIFFGTAAFLYHLFVYYTEKVKYYERIFRKE